jgi:hypothetical protein
MNCLSAETVLRDNEMQLRIEVHVTEDELYDKPPSTLDNIRKSLQSGVLPKKRFHLPPVPFLVKTLEDIRTIVVCAVEAWEGDFPGKRVDMYSRDFPDDLGWLVGKTLELIPLCREINVVGSE